VWDSPQYLELVLAEREKSTQQATRVRRARRETDVQQPRPGGLRRRLARRLVSLGLYLDPQAAGPASS
jgi:hypothetical protein